MSQNFRYEILADLPQPETDLRLWHPGASSSGGRDGVIVRIRPANGRPWIGTFAFGDDRHPGAVTGLYAAPNPDQLLVVSRGAGYLANAIDPSCCEQLNIWPIVDVRWLPRRRLIVLADLTGLAAYGPEGLHWRTRRLAWDDLRITVANEEEIRGEFWDPTCGQMSTFVVDAATGNSSSDSVVPE